MNDSDLNIIAHAKLEERDRLFRIAYSLIKKFPDQFVTHSKRYQAAIEVCSKLHDEIDKTFRIM